MSTPFRIVVRAQSSANCACSRARARALNIVCVDGFFFALPLSLVRVVASSLFFPAGQSPKRPPRSALRSTDQAPASITLAIDRIDGADGGLGRGADWPAINPRPVSIGRSTPAGREGGHALHACTTLSPVASFGLRPPPGARSLVACRPAHTVLVLLRSVSIFDGLGRWIGRSRQERWLLTADVTAGLACPRPSRLCCLWRDHFCALAPVCLLVARKIHDPVIGEQKPH